MEMDLRPHRYNSKRRQIHGRQGRRRHRRWKNPKKGEFTLTWDKGDYVDTLVISADGAGISGSNNKGDRVNVSRLK
jgi:hypothetical protein